MEHRQVQTIEMRWMQESFQSDREIRRLSQGCESESEMKVENGAGDLRDRRESHPQP